MKEPVAMLKKNKSENKIDIKSHTERATPKTREKKILGISNAVDKIV